MTINPQFSLYALVDQRSVYNIFMERRAMLARWCRSIEETVVNRKLHVQVYAGFQQLRYITPVLPRYRQMLENTDQIWLFGTPSKKDADLSGFHTVALHPTDMLTREWFLVVHSPYYVKALIAHETTPPGTRHRDRMFKGMIVIDHDDVARLVEHLESATSGLKDKAFI